MTPHAPLPSGQGPQPAASEIVIDTPILFNADLARAHLAAAKRNRTRRIVSLIISIIITVVLYLAFSSQAGGLSLPVLAIAMVIPVVYLVMAVLKEVRARRTASRVGDGLAMGITRGGLLLADGFLWWPDVRSIAAVPVRGGVDLVVTGADGRAVALPLTYLADTPASIDAAVWALSGGRRRIDFSRIGA